MSIERIEKVWTDWKILNQIGNGSFGKVYKALRDEYGVISYSAIKVISIPQDQQEVSVLQSEGYNVDSARTYYEGIMRDFVSEIKLLNEMKGTSNIVSIEDYKVLNKENEIGWDIYIRMELLTSLIDYTSKKNMEEEEVIKLGIDICTAFELCAKKSIIHRDIKPENIFVSDFGDFKVGDFGIAKELGKTISSLSAKGTPDYMAPEIGFSEKYDSTVDIYSLGLVLYRLMNNNRLPFVDPYAQSIKYSERKEAREKRLNGELFPKPVNSSFALSTVILKACEFFPDNRYKNASQMKEALQEILSSNNLWKKEYQYSKKSLEKEETKKQLFDIMNNSQTVDLNENDYTDATSGTLTDFVNNEVKSFSLDNKRTTIDKLKIKKNKSEKICVLSKLKLERFFTSKAKRIIGILLLVLIIVGGGVFIYIDSTLEPKATAKKICNHFMKNNSEALFDYIDFPKVALATKAKFQLDNNEYVYRIPINNCKYQPNTGYSKPSILVEYENGVKGIYYLHRVDENVWKLGSKPFLIPSITIDYPGFSMLFVDGEFVSSSLDIETNYEYIMTNTLYGQYAIKVTSDIYSPIEMQYDFNRSTKFLDLSRGISFSANFMNEQKENLISLFKKIAPLYYKDLFNNQKVNSMMKYMNDPYMIDYFNNRLSIEQKWILDDWSSGLPSNGKTKFRKLTVPTKKVIDNYKKEFNDDRMYSSDFLVENSGIVAIVKGSFLVEFFGKWTGKNQWSGAGFFNLELHFIFISGKWVLVSGGTRSLDDILGRSQ